MEDEMKTFEKITFAVFFISLIDIFVYKIWLLQIPEWFPYAYELGDIVFVLATAYIASFVFYFLVTFLPQRKQKQNVYKYVNYKVELILNNFKSILSHTSYTEVDINFMDYKMSLEEYSKLFDSGAYSTERDYDNLSEQEIHNFFSRIRYGGGGPVTKLVADGTPETDIVTWGEYLLQNANITHKLVSEILNLLPLLDAEHVTMFSKIQDAPYYYRNIEMTPTVSENTKLGFLAPSFIEYYGLMKILSKELSFTLNNLKQSPNSHIYLNNIGPRKQ